ncbi:endospore germination permease [Paenibacillus pasadenensis]|uniref:GerAB/ArcD/ProY family transporter n=1 Tax=Paenibacillus pasadenensis TaxID=217090 RepID=UPI00203D716E|nr:endospore germination permease [Paenibacillus pasadenensis]
MFSKKLTFLQVSLLILCVTATSDDSIIIPLVLKTAERDAWISVLLATVPGAIVLFACMHIMKTTRNEPLLSWTKRHFGSLAAFLIAVTFIAYLGATSFIVLKDTTHWVDATFLPETPPSVIAAALILLCGFAGYAGIWSIAVCAGMLYPFIILLDIFATAANSQFKHYQYILPVLQHGFGPATHGLIYTAAGIAELFLLLLLRQHMSGNGRILPWMALLFVSIVTLLNPVLDSIAVFSPIEAEELRYPAFELWGLLTLGKDIAHLDFLSIFQWLGGSFIRISVSFYLIVELLQIKKNNVRKYAFAGLTVLIWAIVLWPITDSSFEWFLRRFYYPISLAWIAAILATLWVFSVIIRAKERRQTNASR